MSSKDNPETRGPLLLAALPAFLLWVFLVGVANATAFSSYRFVDVLAVAVLYALVALSLDRLASFVGCFGLPGRLAGALFAGVVLSWHFREQTRPAGVGPTLWSLPGMSRFMLVAAVLASIYLLSRHVSKQPSPVARRAATQCATAAAALVATLAVCFYASNTLRWHLLRQNLLLGTPAYHLFAEPTARLEGAAWARHSQGSPIGQPDWVWELAEGAGVGAGGNEGTGSGDEEGRREQPNRDDGQGDSGVPAPPPHIVFVMLDTLRADALAGHGGDPSWMPALNAYAERSVRFSDVLANASWTRPSLGSFFTGLLPEEHGATGLQFGLSPEVKLLAEILSAQGYETAGFNANGRMVNAEYGFDRGFEVFEMLRDPPAYARADTVTDRVAGWLAERRAREPSRPLFLYVHYLDPHAPYLSSPGTDFRLSPASHDVARGRYIDDVRFLDKELDRLLNLLDQELTTRRLTLVASDHGEEFGEHGARGHAHALYSEVLQIPVIARFEGSETAPSPGVIHAPLEGRDFFDLMVRTAAREQLDLATWADSRTRQVRVATVAFAGTSGRSLSIQNLLRPYRRTIYSRMIQSGVRRYIWSAYGDTEELYDLSTDPAETLNVASANSAEVAALRQQLDAIPPYWVRLAPRGLSPEAVEELRALGYIR